MRVFLELPPTRSVCIYKHRPTSLNAAFMRTKSQSYQHTHAHTHTHTHTHHTRLAEINLSLKQACACSQQTWRIYAYISEISSLMKCVYA
jgi:hypothetical protein